MTSASIDIYSNGAGPDLVRNPFERLASGSSTLWLAAPYFTGADPLTEAAAAGKPVQLLVGLNAATAPDALMKIRQFKSVNVRYLTRRFHAKLYIFDGGVILGSSNLTDGGLVSNREANVVLDPSLDAERVQAAKALFAELWDGALVLTDEVLRTFRLEKERHSRAPDVDLEIEKAIGRAEPPTIHVDSRKVSRDRLFRESLRRLVQEQYRPAFDEVGAVLEREGFRRPDLPDLGLSSETNRFLSWLRETHIPGDDYAAAPLRPLAAERATEVARFGREWLDTDNTRIPRGYFEGLARVRSVFGSEESIAAAPRADLTSGLMSLHAFSDQFRFVKGGATSLPPTFWSDNNGDEQKVKVALAYLLHGRGDFIDRLHDVLFDRRYKLSWFGKFSALELYGTVKPDQCPPMNGRMAKALRFLGYNLSET